MLLRLFIQDIPLLYWQSSMFFFQMLVQYTHWDLIGVVAIQFLVQLAYNNWKWPVVVLKELNFSVKEFFDLALFEFNNKKNDKCK